MRLGIIGNKTEESFDRTRAFGLAFQEICCNNSREAEDFIADVPRFLANIARTGIDVSSVGRWNHTVNHGGHLDAGELDLYKRQLDAAIAIGARTYVCGCNYDDSVSAYRNYTTAIELFGQLIEHAGGKIRIAVQNCEWNNFVVSPRDWRIVLGELPELCLKYDASHAYNRRDDYLAELSEYGERIAHVHIKGTTHAGTRGVADPPAGMDDLKWTSIFATLYARGYDGDLSIEPHSGVWQGALADAGVRFTCDFIRPFILR